MERHCMELLEGWFGSYKHAFSELVGRAGTRSISMISVWGPREGQETWLKGGRYAVGMSSWKIWEEGNGVKWRSTVRNQSASGWNEMTLQLSLELRRAYSDLCIRPGTGRAPPSERQSETWHRPFVWLSPRLPPILFTKLSNWKALIKVIKCLGSYGHNINTWPAFRKKEKMYFFLHECSDFPGWFVQFLQM